LPSSCAEQARLFWPLDVGLVPFSGNGTAFTDYRKRTYEPMLAGVRLRGLH
jgi:hypothetical protein